MKFIAPSDFSQGPGNPLNIPGGLPQVKKGTIFEIGGDLPPEQFSGDDLKIYRQIFAAAMICPLDSEQGRQLAAEFKVEDPMPGASKLGVETEAFVLFNEKEPLVENIVRKLDEQGVSNYFWRRDIPIGTEWGKIETQKLEHANTVLVFLGSAGWGPIHLRITEEAQRLGKRIIAENNRLDRETAIDGLVCGLRNLLPEVTSSELKEQVTEMLDVQMEVKTLHELKGVLDVARSFKGRVRSIFKAAKTQGLGWRLMWLAAAVALPVLLPTIATIVFPTIKG